MKQLPMLLSLVSLGFSYNEEPCRGLGGFCYYTWKCPGRNYVSGNCATQSSSIRCCLSIPYQENACKDAGGICADDTKCLQDGGETVSGKCPKQPSGVMCCIKTAATSEKWETFDLGTTCSCWSRTKSDAIANAQKKESLKYENSIKTASTKHGIPVGVIMGVISRESGFGTLLGKWGSKPGWGDHNNAFGLMQIDKRYHYIDESNIDNIDTGTKILADYLKIIQKKKPDWTLEWQLRGAVAAYNSGPGNVQTQANLDGGTASTCQPCSGNYSWDTMARAQWFAKN